MKDNENVRQSGRYPCTTPSNSYGASKSKDYEGKQDRAKQRASKKWVNAVNYDGGFGKWKLALCRVPYRLDDVLTSVN